MCFLIKRKRGRPINRQKPRSWERSAVITLTCAAKGSGGGLRKQTNFGLRRQI